MNELKCVLETPECVRELGVDQKCFQGPPIYMVAPIIISFVMKINY